MIPSNLFTSSAVALLLSSSMASANPVTFGASGYLAAGIQSDRSVDEFIFGDFNLSAEYNRFTANLGGFGQVGRPHETYVTLGYQLDSGHLELGVPKPAYDWFATSPEITALPHNSLFSIGTTQSRTTQGAITQEAYLPVGLSITSTAETIKYAASLHYVDTYDEYVLGAGGAFETQFGTLEAAAEIVKQPGRTLVNAKAGLSQNVGKTTFAATAYYADANDLGTSLELSAEHDFSDQLSVLAYHRHSFNPDRDHTGVSMAYEIAPKTSVRLSAAYEDNDPIAGALLAREF